MSWQKKLAKIVAVLVFIILLIGTALPSREKLFQHKDLARQKEMSLKKYGFYLEPDNKAANIDFKHTSPDLDAKLNNIAPQIASMGASVSVVDFDNDGWNDLYFTNSKTGSMNALYRNLHNGKFQEVANEMGIADLNEKGTGSSMGAVWADYDNDGYKDLLLYKWGKPELFHNIGGKKFENITVGSGLPTWVKSNFVILFDFNNDGLPEIFIGG